jgi:hypothetical protein
MADRPPILTIREILAHPRYREFAQSCCEHGKQLAPDTFPWNLMGQSDTEIIVAGLCEDGRRMDLAQVNDAIAVVRAQERLVETWWTWWPGWEAVDRRRAAALATIAAARGNPEGLLFEM